MKAVIAIDSLKGSLSSIEAGQAIAEGIKKADAKAEVVIRPLADGGEGTVEALVCGMNGTLQHVKVTGPLGEPVVCEYGIIDETKTAVIEMSGAAGITLVPDTKKNPLYTTTYGVGEVIRDAIGLKELETITDTYVLPELAECEFKIACDVTNPLCGENGCSAVYGPQKGANPSMIMEMDKWLRYYAALAREKFPKADLNEPGTGAAGGLGFAFLTFTDAVLESGIKIVLEETKLESFVKDADVVVTGEGRLDFQTAMGKAPVGVAKLAKKFDIPVLAFAGSVTKDAAECNKNGIDAFFPILRGISTLEEAMKTENAKQNLTDTAEQAFRLFNICRQA